jgi:hypothetical protein
MDRYLSEGRKISLIPARSHVLRTATVRLVSFLQKEGEFLAVITQVSARNLFQTTRIRTFYSFMIKKVTFFKTGSTMCF